MRFVHSLFYAFYLILYSVEGNKDFAIGRATFGPMLILFFLIVIFTLIICSNIFCYEINSVALFGIPIAVSFVLSEHYFTHLGKGDEIVLNKPVVINELCTVVLAILTIVASIYLLVWSFSYSKEIYLSCN